MQNRVTALILMGFLMTMVVPARAENTSASSKVQKPPANMSDAALASYISGRLEPLLKDTGYSVSQSCDSSGCSVVVQ